MSFRDREPQSEGGDRQGRQSPPSITAPSSRDGGNCPSDGRKCSLSSSLCPAISRVPMSQNGRSLCSSHRKVRPSNLIQSSDSLMTITFGILQSHAHWLWFVTKCGKLKSDFRYSAESVYDTFPWPQSPSVAQIDAVADAGRRVRSIRVDALSKIEGGLRAVYRLLELPGKNPLKHAQATLDAAVLAAYGFSPKKDLLAQPAGAQLGSRPGRRGWRTGDRPGIPLGDPDPARLVTEDCIRAN